jgi:hypothetical protein
LYEYAHSNPIDNIDWTGLVTVRVTTEKADDMGYYQAGEKIGQSVICWKVTGECKCCNKEEVESGKAKEIWNTEYHY